MGKLADISGKSAVKAFQKAGWQIRGQVGSHLVLTKPGLRTNLTVPQHSELAPGTLRSLIKTAGLTVDIPLSSLSSFSDYALRLIDFRTDALRFAAWHVFINSGDRCPETLSGVEGIRELRFRM